MSDAAVNLKPKHCRQKIDALYESWRPGVDAIVLLIGKVNKDEETVSRLSNETHLWLFTLIFPDTLIIFTRDKRILFSSTKKKFQFLRSLQDSEVSEQYQLEFYEREGDIEQNIRQGILPALLKLAESNPSVPLTTGVIHEPGDRPTGVAAETIMKILGWVPDTAQLDAEDFVVGTPNESTIFRWKVVNKQFSRLIVVRDGTELESSRLGSQLAKSIFYDVLENKTLQILDDNAQESHSGICRLVDASLDDHDRTEAWRKSMGVDPDGIDISFAICESGQDTFVLDETRPANDQMLSVGHGTICMGLGVKYNLQSAIVARTVMIDATKEERKMYGGALKIQSYIQSLLMPGKTCGEIWAAGLKFMETNYPYFVPHMRRHFGGVLGGQNYAEDFLLAPGVESVLEVNMVISFGVKVLNVSGTEKGGKARNLAFWIEDTGPLSSEGLKEVWTDGKSKKQALFMLREADEPEQVDAKRSTETLPKESSAASSVKAGSVGTTSKASGSSVTGRQHPGARQSAINALRPPTVAERVRSRRSQAGINHQEQEKQMQKQRILRRRKIEEIQERFRDGGVGFTKDKKAIKKLSQFIAYRDVQEFPRDLKTNKVCIDPVRETILLPIYNVHVPFHVAMIRHVSHVEENRTHVLRICFKAPGAANTTAKAEDTNPLPDLSGIERSLFIKELTFKSTDSSFPNTVKNIRDLMRKAKAREQQKEDEEATTQQTLQINRTGKRVILRSLMVRHIGGHSRRAMGQLEAHVNGLRYVAPKLEAIDIIYSNIRSVFFQPVTSDMVVILHFHLMSPILVQKRKVKDVQVYCEASSQTDDLDARRARSTYDPDEILEEQREQERKKRLNAEFRRFIDQMQENPNFTCPVEIPQRKLSFTGVPNNVSVTLAPTSHCLVNLSDWPCFVLHMEDVELVSLERVDHGLRLFDMIFVFKDYNQPVCSVSSIPVESLDMIKIWLNDMDIVWYENKKNLKWTGILRVIRSRVQKFAQEGAFAQFLGDDIKKEKKRRRRDGDEDEEYEEEESEASSSTEEDDDEDEDDEEYVGESGSDEDDDDDDDDSDDAAASGSEDDDDDDDDEDDEDDDDDDDSDILAEDSEDDEEISAADLVAANNAHKKRKAPASATGKEKKRRTT